MATTVQEYINALLARKNASVKSSAEPMVVEIENPALQTVTQFTIYEDGRISVAMKEQGDDDVQLQSQYLARNTQILPDGSFKVLVAGWFNPDGSNRSLATA